VVSVFAPDAARTLGGPDWLRQRREAAAERVSASPLPTTEEEVWRYSRIGELDLDRYHLGEPAPVDPRTLPQVQAVLGHYADWAAIVVVHNGRIAHVDTRSHADDNRHVYVGALADHPEGASLLGSASPDAVDLFAEMNNAFAADPLAVVIDPGYELGAPIVVVHWNQGDGTAAFPRLVVRAGANSQATVVEHVLSSDESLLVAPTVEIVVERDARLGYLNVQQLGVNSWQLASQSSTVDVGATFTASAAAFGGRSARQRTDCRLVGRGATGVLQALYFGNDEQLLDFRTFQDHAARDTTSNLLFKGVVDDEAKAVYTGLIHVRPDARGTNAFQTNRNIKLSDDAWAESVPNLQIENNDVKCSHASTVGPVDEDQRFYLESRGLHPSQAERFIVAGFFDEVLDALPVMAARSPISLAIAEKLPQETS
jgi:Fe-S cluster assembly protein SufD